jgi:hypothetical protein
MLLKTDPGEQQTLVWMYLDHFQGKNFGYFLSCLFWNVAPHSTSPFKFRAKKLKLSWHFLLTKMTPLYTSESPKVFMKTNSEQKVFPDFDPRWLSQMVAAGQLQTRHISIRILKLFYVPTYLQCIYHFGTGSYISAKTNICNENFNSTVTKFHLFASVSGIDAIVN